MTRAVVKMAALAATALVAGAALSGCAKQVNQYPGEYIGLVEVLENGDVAGVFFQGRFPAQSDCTSFITAKAAKIGTPPPGMKVAYACVPEISFTELK